MRRSILNLLVVMLVVPVLAGCWTRTYEWHLKYTFIIETPAGEKRASSVIKMIYEDHTNHMLVGLINAHNMDF